MSGCDACNVCDGQLLPNKQCEKCLYGSYILFPYYSDSYSLPCKHKANTELHYSLLYLIHSSLHSTAHRKLWFTYTVNWFSLPHLWKNNSHCCSYNPISVRLFLFPWCFSEWLALRGVTLACSAIISFNENSSVVWRVNWPLVQGHSAGIWRLTHCRNSVYGNTFRIEGLHTALWPRRSQGRWGHTCLTSK